MRRLLGLLARFQAKREAIAWPQLDDIQRKPIRQQNQHPYLITTHAIHPQNPYKKAGYCTGFVVN